MSQYIARRLLSLIPVLLGVSIVVFSLIRLIPGDPVVVMLGEKARAEDVARVRAEMGFNRPIYIQYGEWMGHVLRGDLGKSIINHTPVMSELKQRLSATIEMIVVGLILGVAIGISVGILSAIKRNSWLDVVATLGALIGVSMPIYWLALILVYALAVNHQIFPPSARLDVDLTVTRLYRFPADRYAFDGRYAGLFERCLALDSAQFCPEHGDHADSGSADPGEYAGSIAPRLCAHRRSQRFTLQRGHHPPRTQERAVADCHRDRAATGRSLGWRAAHRDNFFLAGHGAVDLSGHSQSATIRLCKAQSWSARQFMSVSICWSIFRTRIWTRGFGIASTAGSKE